jgi:hypothetical protein
LKLFGCSENHPVPDIAVAQQNNPTTANVNLYTTPLVENIPRIHFLDMEGENGGQMPIVSFTSQFGLNWSCIIDVFMF